MPGNGGLVAAFALILNELGVQEAKHKSQTMLLDWRFREPKWTLVGLLG